MKLEEFEKELIKKINKSEIVLSRQKFRTYYLVDNLKLQRRKKLVKLFNPEFEQDFSHEFQPCDCFMSIEYNIRGYYYYIKFNDNIYNELYSIFNQSDKIEKYIEEFLIREFEFKDIYFNIAVHLKKAD